MKNNNGETFTEPQTDYSKGQKIFQTVKSVFIYLLAVTIVISALMFANSRNSSKSLFGYRYYIVLTDSMKPELHSGDMVFVKLSNPESISVGDVITFNPSSNSEAYLTHRVTEKLTDYQGTGVTCFRTKGDANNTDDSFLIDESRVIGKVAFHVARLGFIVRFAQLRWYFILIIAVLISVFFILMKQYFRLRRQNSTD